MKLAKERFTSDELIKQELDGISGSDTPPATLQTVMTFLRNHHWIIEERQTPGGTLVTSCFSIY